LRRLRVSIAFIREGEGYPKQSVTFRRPYSLRK
jgi:hypothetical protein